LVTALAAKQRSAARILANQTVEPQQVINGIRAVPRPAIDERNALAAMNRPAISSSRGGRTFSGSGDAVAFAAVWIGVA
jgi:hypothetical protein